MTQPVTFQVSSLPGRQGRRTAAGPVGRHAPAAGRGGHRAELIDRLATRAHAAADEATFQHELALAFAHCQHQLALAHDPTRAARAYEAYEAACGAATAACLAALDEARALYAHQAGDVAHRGGRELPGEEAARLRAHGVARGARIGQEVRKRAQQAEALARLGLEQARKAPGT